MDLDRGTLAKIDRRVLSGLSHDERWRMVRMPVTEALWSTWKRYCDALGISMGRALSALIRHELRSAVADIDGQPVFLTELEGRLDERQAALDARERQLDARERGLPSQQSQVAMVSAFREPTSSAIKVGRNDPCPCGSGLKHKRCHGKLASERSQGRGGWRSGTMTGGV